MVRSLATVSAGYRRELQQGFETALIQRRRPRLLVFDGIEGPRVQICQRHGYGSGPLGRRNQQRRVRDRRSGQIVGVSSFFPESASQHAVLWSLAHQFVPPRSGRQ